MNALAHKQWHPLVLLGQNHDLAVPKAFGRDIFLCSVKLAGVCFYKEAERLEGLPKGTSLTLRRNPGNRHDALAIAVDAPAGDQVGHVPRRDNPVLARLMDAGKSLSAKLESFERRGDWIDISISIHMQNL